MYFQQARRIWLDDCRRTPTGRDEYAVFLSDAEYSGGDAYLRICADSNYQVWINGKMAGFGQYPDYPHYKIYDEIPVRAFLHAGKNRICVVVWYYGAPSQTYVVGEAEVRYELVCGGKVLCATSEQTLSRVAYDYVSGREKSITSQIGFSFCYDMGKYDGYREENYLPKNFYPSRVLRGEKSYRKRPVKRVAAMPFVAARPVAGKPGIYDVGRETVGFLRIRFRAPAGKEFSVLFGEHLADGCVRDKIGPRDFSVELIGSGKEEEHVNYFRRLGCRYLEVREPSAEILEIGLIPAEYPLEKRPYHTADERWQKIYDVCVRTLELCMHEHYEDCPWREQALYTMDSRNQMLCGYYAFGEYAFPRANLELMAQAQKSDRLLPLCFPSGHDVPIPFFSLIYVKAMREYAENSHDFSLLHTYIGLLRDIVSAFVSRVDENCLLTDLKGYWNFYEWSAGMDGIIDEKMIREGDKRRYELPLICFTVLAIEDVCACERMIGEPESFEGIADQMRRAAHGVFYCAEKKVYRTFAGEEHFSKLANALAILAGVAGNRSREVAAAIVAGSDMVETTLSMKTFEYDALLLADPGYRKYILEEIRRNYGSMLDGGATSFWETMVGQADFGDAGSLCHGWSAIPICYLNRLSTV